MLKAIKRFLREEDGFLEIVAPIVGGLLGAKGAGDAAGAQAAAAEKAAKLQHEQYMQTREDLAPFRDAGVNALRTYQDQIGTDFTQTPGYDFRLQQGLDAIEGSAAARGNLMSGATLQALQNYGQDYATNAYENWLNRVGGLTTTGQSSAAQQAALGQNYANAAGNYITQAGQANAQGIAGTYGALAPVVTGIADSIFSYQAPQSGAPTYSPRPMPRPV